jgi:hypothetical protein
MALLQEIWQKNFVMTTQQWMSNNLIRSTFHKGHWTEEILQILNR